MAEMDVSMDVSSAKGKRKHDATVMVDDVEQWAPVGFHPNYEVSTHGKIRNVANAPPTPIGSHVNPTNGLHMKTFSGDNPWVVAKLVLTVFRRPERENEQAIYLDKDRSNLHLSNLKWSSTGNPNRTPAKTIKSREVRVTPGSRRRSLADIFDCTGGWVYSDGTIDMPSGKLVKAIENHQDRGGYQRVYLTPNKEIEKNRGTGIKNIGEHKDIHRLVAMAFLPAPDFINPQVDHINGRKWDNRVENLEYVTNKQNSQRAHDSGNYTPPHQIRVRLYEFDKGTEGYTFKKEYDNQTAAGEDIGFSQKAVANSCARKKDELPKARKYAKSTFFKTHAFRLSEGDDLA